MNRNNYREMLNKLGDVSDALSMRFNDNVHLHRKYLNPFVAWISRFLGFNKKFVRASGCYLFDGKGKRYLDFLAGFGALNLGHEPSEVIAAMQQVEGTPNILQSSLNPIAGKLAEYLSCLTAKRLSRVFFCNSGTEACEAAVKLARAASKRTWLVHAEGGYHGKTMGSLSVSGKEKYKVPFLPLLGDTISVPYNDVEVLERVFKKRNVAAFIIEPVQGEAGVIVPKDGYLKLVREVCSKYGVILIFDEVQTGMGRTGRFFCYEHEDAVPDILLLSKSLGGGVMPIGAIVAKDALWQRAYGSLQTCLLHTSTFGGNTRACACGIAAIRMILSKNLTENAGTVGNYLLSELRKLQEKFDILRSVRGRGLMIGLTLARLKGKNSLMEGAVTLWVARQLLKRHRIITAFTLNNYDVLRIAPPLLVNHQDVDYFIGGLADVLKSAENFRHFHLVKREEVKPNFSARGKT